jgi:hypothetical protein
MLGYSATTFIPKDTFTCYELSTNLNTLNVKWGKKEVSLEFESLILLNAKRMKSCLCALANVKSSLVCIKVYETRDIEVDEINVPFQSVGKTWMSETRFLFETFETNQSKTKYIFYNVSTGTYSEEWLSNAKRIVSLPFGDFIPCDGGTIAPFTHPDSFLLYSALQGIDYQIASDYHVILSPSAFNIFHHEKLIKCIAVKSVPKHWAVSFNGNLNLFVNDEISNIISINVNSLEWNKVNSCKITDCFVDEFYGREIIVLYGDVESPFVKKIAPGVYLFDNYSCEKSAISKNQSKFLKVHQDIELTQRAIFAKTNLSSNLQRSLFLQASTFTLVKNSFKLNALPNSARRSVLSWIIKSSKKILYKNYVILVMDLTFKTSDNSAFPHSIQAYVSNQKHLRNISQTYEFYEKDSLQIFVLFENNDDGPYHLFLTWLLDIKVSNAMNAEYQYMGKMLPTQCNNLSLDVAIPMRTLLPFHVKIVPTTKISLNGFMHANNMTKVQIKNKTFYVKDNVFILVDSTRIEISYDNDSFLIGLKLERELCEICSNRSNQNNHLIH